jgi:anaerobic selenocysteine-containing dehydrogenase
MRPEAASLVNPLKAKEIGLTAGDWIEVESPRGKITIRVKITNAVAPDTIYIPGGWAEANYNQLSIADQFCPISSQQNYTVCLVKIAKVQKEGGK